MTVTRPIAALLLLICTALWGFAFIAQKTAMDSMGPLTFAAMRYLLGSIVILPFALWDYRRGTAKRGFTMTRNEWLVTGVLCLSYFIGNWLQQTGLTLTTVTNSGFLTSLYVLFVPLLAFIIFRTRPHTVLYLGVPLALLGIFLLNGARLDSFNSGDLMMVACAVFWGMQVLLLGYIARRTGLPIFVSALSFIVTGVLSLIFAFILEKPDLSGIFDGWIEIAYAGILSTAVAFTLQAIGQQHVPAANAAIILSAESLFAAVGAAILLHERLPLIGYAGAALIFIAIVLVEAIPAMIEQRRTRGAQSTL